MRKIKFRGYDTDTKRWYYGSYARLERTSPYPMSPTPEADNEKHEKEQIDHYIFFTEMNDWGLETKKLRATVDPKSVGQYTGLADCDDAEAWEGDLVERTYEFTKSGKPKITVDQIIYEPSEARYKFFHDYGNGHRGYSDLYSGHKVYPWRIIGNTYGPLTSKEPS